MWYDGHDFIQLSGKILHQVETIHDPHPILSPNEKYNVCRGNLLEKLAKVLDDHEGTYITITDMYFADHVSN